MDRSAAVEQAGPRSRRSVPVGTVASEYDRVVVNSEGRVTFGRSPENDVRIGHAPVSDDSIARQAGAIFDVHGRLAVENSGSRLAFDVYAEGRSPYSVPPGAWISPVEPTFEIRVGGVMTHTISVAHNVHHVATLIVGADEPIRSGPPTGARLVLTERQRQVVEAYVEPLAEGGGPATHGEVAAKLHMSRALVRSECGKIWSAMLLAGIPMRELADARDQIVDAWSRHRL